METSRKRHGAPTRAQFKADAQRSKVRKGASAKADETGGKSAKSKGRRAKGKESLADSAVEAKDETQSKLLLASIEVFGTHGFESASTRLLATHAGVNLQAIPYYFGSKEGLYLAVAEHIASRIRAHMEPLAEKIRSRLDLDESGKARHLPSPDEARGLLVDMLTTFAHLLVSDETESWASFIIREQQHPSAAFERLYDGGMGRYIGTATQLVAAILGRPPQSKAVQVQAIGLIGHILIFRSGRAAVLRALGWRNIGTSEFSEISQMIERNVLALQASGAGRLVR